MSLKLNTGDLTIQRIIEQETTFLPALEILPALTPDLPAENRPIRKKPPLGQRIFLRSGCGELAAKRRRLSRTNSACDSQPRPRSPAF
jgi:hypothetical protein